MKHYGHALKRIKNVSKELSLTFSKLSWNCHSKKAQQCLRWMHWNHFSIQCTKCTQIHTNQTVMHI